jgi:hypothetical protein
MSGGDPGSLIVDVVAGSVDFADIQDFINFGHVQGIEKDHLRSGVMSEYFLPEFYRLFEAGEERKRLMNCRIGLRSGWSG